MTAEAVKGKAAEVETFTVVGAPGALQRSGEPRPSWVLQPAS